MHPFHYNGFIVGFVTTLAFCLGIMFMMAKSYRQQIARLENQCNLLNDNVVQGKKSDAEMYAFRLRVAEPIIRNVLRGLLARTMTLEETEFTIHLLCNLSFMADPAKPETVLMSIRRDVQTDSERAAWLNAKMGFARPWQFPDWFFVAVLHEEAKKEEVTHQE
ncbi:MAG: hypothetical protein HY565_02965 [Candidatus Kerfeldbacteria bacterium]|nr:hypothetical protein [Candidatus Kerfeldbacteria bacterium]